MLCSDGVFKSMKPDFLQAWMTADAPLEEDVSVGHGAIVHGATVRKGALIGMNATVLDKADIGEGAIIAAGAVVTHGTKVPAHEIWAGIPARKVKACAPGQAEEFAKHYSGYIKDWYLKED